MTGTFVRANHESPTRSIRSTRLIRPIPLNVTPQLKKARRIGEPFSYVLLLRETGYGLVGQNSFSIGVLNLDVAEGDVLGIVHLGTLAADEETVLHLQVAERHLGQTIEPHGTSSTLTDNVGDKEVAETWSLLGHGRNGIGAGSVLVAVAYDGFVGIIEVEGESIGIDTVYFARFTSGDDDKFAVMFDQGDGGNVYWDEKGESLRRAFLKAPLEFKRISSGFSYARKHPVTGQVRPHTAVD